jgi:hypothetical protein
MGMKATDLLLNQHREVEKLFEQLENLEEGDQKAVREELAQNLVAHSAIEKEIFYPALKETLPEWVDEAYVEHGMVEYALAQLIATRTTDARFRAKATVLKELVLRHVKEEESLAIKQAEGALGADRLEHLGEQMEVRFEHIRTRGYKSLLKQSLAETAPRTMTRAMPKKTAAKATAGAKRTTPRRGPARASTARASAQPRPTAKRGAAAGGRKGSTRTTRGSRPSSR